MARVKHDPFDTETKLPDKGEILLGYSALYCTFSGDFMCGRENNRRLLFSGSSELFLYRIPVQDKRSLLVNFLPLHRLQALGSNVLRICLLSSPYINNHPERVRQVKDPVTAD